VLALIVLATTFAVDAQTSGLPTLSEVAKAHSDFVNEPCERGIDICADMVGWWSPTGAEDIKNLQCHLTGQFRATCTFDVGSERCKGRFTRRADVTEALWGLRRDRRAGFTLMMRCRPQS